MGLLAGSLLLGACGHDGDEGGPQVARTTQAVSVSGMTLAVVAGASDQTFAGKVQVVAGTASCPSFGVVNGTACEVQGRLFIVAATCGNGVVEEGEECESPFAACCDSATCKLKAAGTECRAAAGGCDLAEACDGSSAACPADAFVAAGVGCRPAAGDCDVAEACTGASAACPADAKALAGTVCRTAAGVCDVAEVCDGSSVACPADQLAAAGTECRAAAGACDVAETCDGLLPTCPGDGWKAVGTECRAAAGVCDVAESCTGTSADCPADAFVAVGISCNDGMYCTVSDQCNGAGACTGAARDCSALGDGKCKVGSCNEAMAECQAVTDPNGDGNACTTDDTCAPTTGVWTAATNICGGPGSFTAKPGADGITLTWTKPTDVGLTAIEVYRTHGGETITKPGAQPEARIYTGLATEYLDATAPAGEIEVYTAFALYGTAGWSSPRMASAQRDDSDGDGMPDGWEIANGLDPFNPGDAALDPDGDGLSNLMEYVYGTNPAVADTDGDGLKDGQEVALGLDPTKQDTDGDGMADAFEISMGLDPLNGHDFAIGNFMYSENFRLGAYVVDSGRYDASGFASENNKVVIASQQQMTPIGVSGWPGGYTYGGYLYTIEEFIAPNYPPQCDAGPDQSVNLPATVVLAGSASDPNGDPVTFAWQFVSVPPLSTLTNASLSGATTPAPSFTPDVYGYYMLQLAVADVTGLSSAPCYVIVTAVNQGQFYVTGPFISVSESNKLVAATTSTAGTLPLGMSSATNQVGSVMGDRGPTADGPVAGTSYQLIGKTLASGEFQHAAAGFMATAFALYDVTTNIAPVADAGPDQTVPFGTTVVLDGSGSYDPDSYPQPLTYEWSIWSRPYGSTAAIVNATAKIASLTPDKAGSYVALLRVRDGEITSVPSPVVITVANTPPIAKAGPDQVVKLTSPAPTIQLDGSGSLDPEGKAITYQWRFFRKPDGSTGAAPRRSPRPTSRVPRSWPTRSATTGSNWSSRTRSWPARPIT